MNLSLGRTCRVVIRCSTQIESLIGVSTRVVPVTTYEL